MKVLVTGASGRLGPFVVAELERAGHELVLFSRTRPAAAGRWPWIPGSITDPDDVAQAFAAAKFDAVQHLAAQPWPTDRPQNRKQAADKGLPVHWTMQANVMGVYHMLQAALAHGVERFVMTGSNCALGHGFRISQRPFPFRRLPVDEEHPSDCEDSYSMSKLMGEMLCRQHSDAYGMRTHVVRAAGICPPQRRAEMAASARKAEAWSEWLWAWVGSEDVASAHRLLMEQADDIPAHGAYFCNAPDTTLLDETKECVRRLNPELAPLAEGIEGHGSFFSTRKLEQTVGWKHRTTWRDLVAK